MSYPKTLLIYHATIQFLYKNRIKMSPPPKTAGIHCLYFSSYIYFIRIAEQLLYKFFNIINGICFHNVMPFQAEIVSCHNIGTKIG